jgi:hypothetical protein
MDKFMLFVSAVAAHWLFTFGGIAMVVFGLYEKFKHKETAKWVFWGLAVVLLLVAFYQAWSDEHANAAVVIEEKARAIGDLGECRGDLKSVGAQSAILQSQVLSQQSTINGQQSTLTAMQQGYNSQQSTINSCVVSLGKTNAPMPLQLTSRMDSFTLPDPKWKHHALMTVLVNQALPARLKVTCDGTIGEAHAIVAGASSFMDITKKLFTNSIIISNPVVMTTLSPLIVTISYDEDDIGTCNATVG